MGAEIEANLTIDGFGLQGAFTYMDSEDHATALDLPLRPRNIMSANAHYEFDVGRTLSIVRLSANLDYMGANFVDPANLIRIPPRFLISSTITFGLLSDAVQLRLSVRDLLDERPFDFVGFPMPGRSFAAAVHWRAF